VKLSAEQQAWLEAHIENGEFASIDDVLGWLINERMAEESGDMAWARHYVDEARGAVASGDTITLKEHRARNAFRLASFNSK